MSTKYRTDADYKNYDYSGFTYKATHGGNLARNAKSSKHTDYYIPATQLSSMSDADIDKLIDATINRGSPLSYAEVIDLVGGGSKDNKEYKLAYYKQLLDTNADLFGFDSTGENTGTDTSADAQTEALNAYYEDAYSLADGTLGADIYNRLTTAEQHAALANKQLADAQYQNAALQQAATVKSITDQVRAERMSRLRAGMSEAQIANQDMQSMIANVNALNDQLNAMNYSNLQAQQQYNLAQDTAYQQYLDQANAMSTAGAAYAASDAGDVHMQTLRRMAATGETYATASKKVQGQT